MTSITHATPTRQQDAGTAFERYLAAASAWGGRVGPLLAALRAVEPGELLPLPGSGRTSERLRLLARVAEADLTAVRVLEPHVDAVAILAEAGHPAPERGTTWGVFAAEAPDAVTEAVRDGDRWLLRGRKAWCSLAGELTHALVTARTVDGERRMFAVDLRLRTVTAEPARWVARGLAEVVSGPVRFDDARGTPLGGDGWYLDRPGFRWGAIGVAACWWGGCLPILDALAARVRSRPDDALAAARLGALHRALDAGRLALREAALQMDAGAGPGSDLLAEPDASGASAEPAVDRAAVDPAALAHGVRGTVADAVVVTLDAARDVLGPAALAFDESLARRCADLELYVSQYHRGRDDASLAGHLAERPLTW